MTESYGGALGRAAPAAPAAQHLATAADLRAADAPRDYARSNATRLLSAGVYLEKSYRRRVIHELLTSQFRVVAPSYGYDAVTVLAHALAARRLRRQQVACMCIGVAIDYFLLVTGFIGLASFLVLAIWILWAFTFLRRAATLQALITRLSKTATGSGAADSFPANPALTAQLADKISRQQAGAEDRIYFGSYMPFVGAGLALDDWTTAVLLIPAKPSQLEEYRRRNEGEEQSQARAQELIPFTVAEITNYVGRRLRADLQEEAPYGEQIENLTVERRKYSRAGVVPLLRRGLFGRLLLPAIPSAAPAFGLVEDQERYDTAREYLCIRVGSWHEEVVTSVFVGFDLRGKTLYSEFYSYVLPPVQESFHMVDRLPDRLTPRLLLKVAWDVPAGLPGSVRQAVRTAWWRVRSWTRRRTIAGLVSFDDVSELRLGRYAVATVDRGALHSVRELAASDEFHVFFQQADTLKYIKIVQRRLLQIVRDFLAEHNVDLGDHDRQGASIVDNSVHNHADVNNYGGTNTQGGTHTWGSGGTGRDGR